MSSDMMSSDSASNNDVEYAKYDNKYDPSSLFDFNKVHDLGEETDMGSSMMSSTMMSSTMMSSTMMSSTMMSDEPAVPDGSTHKDDDFFNKPGYGYGYG